MKLTCKEKGEGEVIIFVHSYLFDSNMWNEQMELLSKKYKCIAIDLPSHSKEVFSLKKEYTLNDLAQEILDFIETKKIEKFHYVGLSVGGMLAPYLYEAKKENIRSITIMDSYSGSEGAEKQNLYFKLLDAIEIYKTIPKPLSEQIANMFFAKDKCNADNKNYTALVERLESFKPENLKDIVILGRAIFSRESKLDVIKEIECPLYFIVGSEDEPRPPKESFEMSKLNIKSKYIEVKNAGHISNLDNPEFVNKIFSEIF